MRAAAPIAASSSFVLTPAAKRNQTQAASSVSRAIPPSPIVQSPRQTKRVFSRIPETLHAAASFSYAVGMPLLAVYRLVTREARRSFYHQIAVASHHHHIWTFWEKFNLGGFDDALTIPTAMALGYLTFLAFSTICAKNPAFHASPRTKIAAHAITALVATAILELGYALTPSGVDVMNVLAYGVSGIAAALLSFLFWWPRSQTAKPVKLLDSFKADFTAVALGAWPFASIFDGLAYGHGLAINFAILAAYLAVPCTIIFAHLREASHRKA
jgi:hypothetical protein